MQWYKDPIFGVILLLGIIACAVGIDLIRNKWREKKRLDCIDNLKKSYEFLWLQDGVEEFLTLSNNPIPTLEFIARIYTKSGHIKEAIKIYMSILEHTAHSEQKVQILYELGNAYMSAGFLQRAKEVFLEILSIYPHNTESLDCLLKVYERLGEHQNALHALDTLEEVYGQSIEQGKQPNATQYMDYIALTRAYLQCLVIYESTQSISEKCKNLVRIKNAFPKLERVILELCRDLNTRVFWQEAIKATRIENLFDIFWKSEKKSVPLEHIKNPHIQAIYQAKGWLKQTTKDNLAHTSQLSNTQQFHLETYTLLQKYSKYKADLRFEYRCNECNHILPFYNARCPNCNAIASLEVISKLTECDNETHNPVL